MLANDNLHPEMDPDYTSQIFKTRKKLLSSITAPTIFPDNQLSARDLLDPSQLLMVKNIRSRRLAPVLKTFQSD